MKNIGNIKHFNEDDKRFATSEDVANYRADRLKCNKIVDLCSGIGVQAGAFARTCDKVLAVEIDERKVKDSIKNFPNENIEFIQGDVLDEKIIEKIKEFKPNIIFCDPERLAEEKERTIISIRPDLKKLIEFYSKITKNICIEIPPRIELEKLKAFGLFEAEYLSVNNKLNRLDLYFGDINKTEVSVVDVFSRFRIEKSKKPLKIKIIKNPLRYLFEISEAIIKANLVNEYAKKMDCFILENSNNKIFLTSDDFEEDEVLNLSKPYEVIGICNNLNETIRILKIRKFGKAVLKYPIEPKEYWKERNLIENQLDKNMKKEANLFKINNEFVIGEEI